MLSRYYSQTWSSEMEVVPISSDGDNVAQQPLLLLARPNLQKRRAENFEKFKIDFGDSDIRRKNVSLEHPCNGEPRPYVSVHQEHAPAACSATSVFFRFGRSRNWITEFKVSAASSKVSGKTNLT